MASTPRLAQPFRLTAVIALIVGVALAAPAAVRAQESIALGQPAALDGKSPQPGLDVLYVYGDFKDVDNMPLGDKLKQMGNPGKPIAKVDQKSRDGELFEAGRKQLYGMHITGYIKFDKPGDWVIGALSNDGVRVKIDGKIAANDPDIHADRYSQPVQVKVPQAGYYPILIQYFQRKNTAALQLLWQAPDGASLEIVPASALFH